MAEATISAKTSSHDGMLAFRGLDPETATLGDCRKALMQLYYVMTKGRRPTSDVDVVRDLHSPHLISFRFVNTPWSQSTDGGLSEARWKGYLMGRFSTHLEHASMGLYDYISSTPNELATAINSAAAELKERYTTMKHRDFDLADMVKRLDAIGDIQAKSPNASL